MSKRMSTSDRREQIVEIARDEFGARGLAAASIDTIAQQAGITAAYVFRIFGTKKALFLETVEESYAQLIAGLRRATEGESGIAAVDLMAPEYLERLTDRGRLRMQLQALAACDDAEVRDAVRTQFGQLWNAVAEITGMDRVAVKAFLGFGLFMSAATAMEIDAIDDEWAKGAATTVHGGLFANITDAWNTPARLTRKESA